MVTIKGGPHDKRIASQTKKEVPKSPSKVEKEYPPTSYED